MMKRSFKMVDNNGVEKEYDVLFTFEGENGKNYIVYTDNTKDDNGNIEVYASTFDPTDPHTRLKAIETDKEWKVIETILETLQEEVRNKKNRENDEQ